MDLIGAGVRCGPDVASSRETRRLDRVDGMAGQQAYACMPEIFATARSTPRIT
ncbi:hypothetical protein [Arthrobacter sp. CG_A4]|uniref:hypothetical protein n=1 Tax=Arthrobacter sp. CG_A4 TaxID=3071706 RepID=UPI003FA3872E